MQDWSTEKSDALPIAHVGMAESMWAIVSNFVNPPPAGVHGPDHVMRPGGRGGEMNLRTNPVLPEHQPLSAVM